MVGGSQVKAVNETIRGCWTSRLVKLIMMIVIIHIIALISIIITITIIINSIIMIT